MTSNSTTTNTGDFAGTVDVPRVAIPLVAIRELGLEAAAYLQQAAYLSTAAKRRGGWFDLPREGTPDPSAIGITKRYGSWKTMLGISKDAQTKIRHELQKRGLLEVERRGIPCRLHYRVDLVRYQQFIASLTKDALHEQTVSEISSTRERKERQRDDDQLPAKQKKLHPQYSGNNALYTGHHIDQKSKNKRSLQRANKPDRDSWLKQLKEIVSTTGSENAD